MKKFAADTTISVSKTRAEIYDLLTSWKCLGIAWMDDFEKGQAELQFKWRRDETIHLARIKAAMNAVEAGIVEPEAIFLPWLVGSTGETFAEVALPRLSELLIWTDPLKAGRPTHRGAPGEPHSSPTEQPPAPSAAPPDAERARALADRALEMCGGRVPYAKNALRLLEVEALVKIRTLARPSFGIAVAILQEFAEDAKKAGGLL